jgi:hypothetical protein
MGVFSGKDLFSPKWPTAIIIDASNTAHFFQIKHPVGDYFFSKVNDELYAFDMKGDSIKWRKSMAKSFEFQFFFTDHYKPMSPHIKELELISAKNDLPKLSLTLYKVLHMLKLREKKDFQSFKVKSLLDDLSKEKDDDPKRYAQYQDVISYLKDLDVDEIVTPVKRVSEYLEESFMATDPKYMGSVKTAVQLALTENREVNHNPISAKGGWIKILAVMMGVGLLGTLLYLGYTSGTFDGITAMIPDISNVSLQPQQAVNPTGGYDSPEAAKAAIDSGNAKITDFPSEMRSLINSVETPTVAP